MLFNKNKQKEKLNTYWQICPKDDGYTVLCSDCNGEYYLLNKSKGLNDDVLIFSSRKSAETYIAHHLADGNEYVAEAVLVNQKFIY